MNLDRINLRYLHNEGLLTREKYVWLIERQKIIDEAWERAVKLLAEEEERILKEDGK